MKLFLLSLIFIAPASAQSIDPIVYGKLYCQMRSMGVNSHVSRSISIQQAWLSDAPKSDHKANVRAAADYVAKNCYEYLGN